MTMEIDFRNRYENSGDILLDYLNRHHRLSNDSKTRYGFAKLAEEWCLATILGRDNFKSTEGFSPGVDAYTIPSNNRIEVKITRSTSSENFRTRNSRIPNERWSNSVSLEVAQRRRELGGQFVPSGLYDLQNTNFLIHIGPAWNETNQCPVFRLYVFRNPYHMTILYAQAELRSELLELCPIYRKECGTFEILNERTKVWNMPMLEAIRAFGDNVFHVCDFAVTVSDKERYETIESFSLQNIVQKCMCFTKIRNMML